MKRWMVVLPAATLALALAGCGSWAPPKEVPPKPFIGTKWVAQLERPLPGEQPSVRFGDGRMEGFGGCNRIEARFVQDTVGARAVVIGRINSGMRACDPSAQGGERRMLEVLQAVSSYSVTEDMLVMSGSAGTLKFVADPPYDRKKKP